MGKALLLITALVSMAMGGVFSWIGISTLRAARSLQTLDRLNVARLASGGGREGYVEGEIEPGTPVLHKDLVLYLRSRLYGFRRDREEPKRPIWNSLDKALPAFEIETADGAVAIFGSYSVSFRGSDPIWVTTEELIPGESERYEGLRAGQRVTVVGQVARDSSGRWGLDAKRLISGSFEEAVAADRGSGAFAATAGGVLCLVALALVAVAIAT